MFDPKLKQALARVQKPGRYTGGSRAAYIKINRRWICGLRSASRTPTR